MDGCCERLGPGLFAEPLNAVSNLAFLVAAVAVFLFARRTSVHGRVLAGSAVIRPRERWFARATVVAAVRLHQKAEIGAAGSRGGDTGR